MQNRHTTKRKQAHYSCLCSLIELLKPKFHLARHVTSWHDSTHSTRRASPARGVKRVEPCCSTSSTLPKCMGSTRRTCRVVTWRAESNLGFTESCYKNCEAKDGHWRPELIVGGALAPLALWLHVLERGLPLSAGYRLIS